MGIKKAFGAIGHWFESLWRGISGQLATSIEAFLKSFVQDDLAKIAVDAVNYVNAKFEGAVGIQKRDAAVEKFKQDAAAAGHDVAKFAESVCIWFVETALQAVKAGVAASAGEPGEASTNENAAPTS